jgi:Mrp family chromosome partitioning ATPase
VDLIEYLRTFRRRWLVIVATIVVAMIAALFTTQTIAPAAPSPPTYQASTLLASSGGAVNGVTLTPDTLAVFATIDSVARRAAKDLGFEGEPEALLRSIQASPDSTTGVFLSITGFGPTPRRAEKIADTFATALTDYLRDRRDRGLRARIAELEKSIRNASQAGNVDAVAAFRAEVATLDRETLSTIGISVFEKARAQRVGSTAFTPPDSALVRLAIAAVIGLLAGAGIALLLERVDTKIRTSEQATERFGYPVLAEIPTIPRHQRKGVITAEHPTSPSSDAFRLLGAGVHVAVRPSTEDDHEGRGRIILVTSSGPSEGKSTVVANLAAVLAEEGKKVTLFSADLRRPTLHDVLGVDIRPGLVQAAREPEPAIRQYKRWTNLDRVMLVPSGGGSERPGEVLASPGVASLLREACDTADWVVLDTAPILVAGESAPLIDEADLVLIVARSGMISNSVAERTRDTLHRLGADAAWVVLNASRESSVPSGYRRYQVEADKDAQTRAASTKGFPG